MKKRILAGLLAACLVMGMLPAMAFSAEEESQQCEHVYAEDAAFCVDRVCTLCEETVPGSAKHESLVNREGKEPTYLSEGWGPYVACEKCDYSTRQIIPAKEPYIDNYEDFLYYLPVLEELAQMYVKENPGKDPIALVIKYIRTGVDRYNSGSWGIMAGYEDAGFASYVRQMQNSVNNGIIEENGGVVNEDDLFWVTSLKNIKEFGLPNGDWVDFGHMFGTMDISYHNKGSQNHADVAGWAGDLVDLMTSADKAYAKYGDSTVDSTVALELPADLDLETMVGQIGEKIFLKSTSTDDKFTLTDFYGDIDGMYVVDTLYNTEYKFGDMTNIIKDYFNKGVNDEVRASYFLNQRLGNSGTRSQVRTLVYEEFSSNKVVTTLEGTRVWLNTDNAYKTQLRKAVCYAFADYVCMLAGDYVESGENRYYTDFSSELTQLAPGVTQEIRKATSADGKQMVYYLATADLSNPYVTVNANYANNDPTKWEPARVLDQANAAQEKRSNPENEYYVPNYQIVAAINADGFNMSNGTPSGVLVMDGKEWNAPNQNGFFGITVDGRAVIGTTEEYRTIYKNQLQDAVSGFGITLVKDGKINVAASDNYYADRASRTAVGITKTGKVVFMVLDGRQEPISCGGSMIEIAQIMLEAGCVDAINLDGGGSTTYVSKPEGKAALEVTNKPSDGYARNVSSSLIIVSTAPSSTAFDHAIVESEYSYITIGTSVQLKAAGVSATGNVAEMPEGYTWAVSDPTMAEITEDGVFTSLKYGEVDVRLMLGDEIIGSKTMTTVIPDSVYFTRKTMSAVYGSSITLPAAALYEGKPVAINEDDVFLTVSPATAGSCNGFKFTANETTIKSAQIVATLVADDTVSGSITVNLYQQGENTFDFEQADGIDEPVGWVREVSNSSFDGAMTYTVLDREEGVDVSYIFAVDMSQLTMPEKLTDLIYMLPGADDPNASAWNFLLQLAERISVLTEVTATIKVDDRFTVNVDNMNIINEYFYLKDKKVNEETSEVTLVLRWKDQTAAIEASTANPICIINGVKITPKDDAFESTDTITVTNRGSISYKVYLRANALYSFCQDPANREQFGLEPFQNNYIDANNAPQFEQGGYFVNDNFKTFEDYFTLSKAMKQGWVKEAGGWAYYVDDEALTGVQLIDGYYYDFGENGLNVGQAKFNGIFTDAEGGMHYARTGEIVTSGWIKEDNQGYHCHADGYLHKATINDPTNCITGGWITYVCDTCKNVPERVGSYVFPEGHAWDNDYVCLVCNHKGQDITKATVKLLNGSTVTDPGKSYYYQTSGTRLGAYVSFDGVNRLSYSNDANVNDDHTMKDLYIAWNNDRGLGKVTLTIDAKGNYYGNAVLEYFIVPYEVKALTAETVGEDAVLLKWTPGNKGVDGADGYRIYLDDGDNRVDNADKLVADVDGTSYIVTGLEAGNHTFYVVAYAVSDNPDENGKIYNSPTNASKMSFATASTETSVPKLEDPKVIQGETEDEAFVEITFDGIPKTDGSWTVMVITYGEAGEMISVATETVTGANLTVAMKRFENAHHVKVYLLGKNNAPLTESVTVGD